MTQPPSVPCPGFVPYHPQPLRQGWPLRGTAGLTPAPQPPLGVLRASANKEFRNNAGESIACSAPDRSYKQDQSVPKWAGMGVMSLQRGACTHTLCPGFGTSQNPHRFWVMPQFSPHYVRGAVIALDILSSLCCSAPWPHSPPGGVWGSLVQPLPARRAPKPLLWGGAACRSLHLAPSLAGEHAPSATTTRAAPKRSHKGREVLVPLTTPLGTFLGLWWHFGGAYPKAAVPPEPTAPQREAEPVAQKSLLCVSFAAWQWEHASFL